MKSHAYQFSAKGLLAICALPLGLVLLFAGITRGLARFGALPPPRPIHDVDRTILLHQASAARAHSHADIILIGDSSCLMDVSAPELALRLGGNHSVLNLATLSYLDLAAHARLIREYNRANPGILKTVILLLHPESLRLGSRNAYFSTAAEKFFGGEDWCGPSDSKLLCAASVGVFKDRVLTRVLPVALPSVWGRAYGFNWNLWQWLTKESGSAADPHVFNAARAEGNPEYRLSETLKPASAAFRSSLPAGVQLVIGITPSPRSFALPNHSEKTARMLRQWSLWIEAGATLDLPATLPDSDFASTTHLTGAAAARYTDLLAGQLAHHGLSAR